MSDRADRTRADADAERSAADARCLRPFVAHLGAAWAGRRVSWLAAAPPDRNGSFMGSGLPFPNERAAFFETPNAGEAVADARGDLRVAVRWPNAYYDAGRQLVPPTLHVRTADGAQLLDGVQMGPIYAHRFYHHPPRQRFPPVAVANQDALLLAFAGAPDEELAALNPASRECVRASPPLPRCALDRVTGVVGLVGGSGLQR